MIKIISVGKLTQKYLLEGIGYYQKQIPVKIEFIEVTDEKTASGIEIEKMRILSKLKDSDYIIALAIQGKMIDSYEFSNIIDQIMTYEQKDIVFIIGGSYGLSEEILIKANLKISFSKMTFPHQLMKLILIEQIYRGYMILKNHPYHK
jgi:23S rRNA (pseudouridine1915-N3)-methyltransferase